MIGIQNIYFFSTVQVGITGFNRIFEAAKYSEMKYLCAAETYFEFFEEFKYYQYYSKGDSSNPTSIMFSGAPPGLVMLAAPPQPVSDLQVSLHIRVGKFHGPTYLS